MTIAINVCIELAPYLIFKHVISTSQNICCPHMLDILVSQNVVLLQHVCRPVETVSRFNDKASWKRIWNAIMEMCKCGKWLVQWSPRTSGAYWIWGDIDGVGYGATSVSGGSRRGDYTLHYSIPYPVHILLSLHRPFLLIFSHILPASTSSELFTIQQLICIF